MKIRILSIIVLLFVGSCSFGQSMVNADNVINGAVNKWLPNSLGYYQAIEVPAEGTVPGPGRPVMMSVNGSLFQIQFCTIYAAQCQTLYADGFGGAVLAGNQTYSQLSLRNPDGSGTLALGNSGSSAFRGDPSGNTGVFGLSTTLYTSSGNPVTLDAGNNSGYLNVGKAGAQVYGLPDGNLYLLSRNSGNIVLADNVNLSQSIRASFNSTFSGLSFLRNDGGVQSNANIILDQRGFTFDATRGGCSAGVNCPNFNFASRNNVNFVSQGSSIFAGAVDANYNPTQPTKIKFSKGSETIYEAGGVSTYFDTNNQYSHHISSAVATDGTPTLVVYGERGISDETYFLTQIGSSVFIPNAAVYTDDKGRLQTAELTHGTALVGDDSDIPRVTDVLTKDESIISCEFNAGATPGTTSVSVNVHVSRVGSNIILNIPAFGAVFSGGAVLSTDSSANPACLAQFAPTSFQGSFAVTNSNNVVSQEPGYINITPTGNIAIYYKYATDASFPGGVYGGLGFNSSDTGYQTFTYNSPLIEGFSITTSVSSGGSISPTSEIWQSDTTELNFVISPDVNHYINSVTDDCDGGSPGGSLVDNIYTLTNVNQACVITVNFGLEYNISTSINSGTISPPTAQWIDGVTTVLDFTITPPDGNGIASATDNCNSGAPGGSLGSGVYSLTTVNQNCQIDVVTSPEFTPIVTSSNDFEHVNIVPTQYIFYPGITESAIFNISVSPGYTYTATDNCNAGSPGGSLVGDVYTITEVTLLPFCYVILTVNPVASYTVSSSSTNMILSPSTATWTPGQTTQLNFSVDRVAGYQYQSITDNCDGGSQAGVLNGSTYTLNSVTSNCSITLLGEPTVKIMYLDITASGSLAVIPNSAYAVPNMFVYGFADITSATLPTPQVDAIVNAVLNQSGETINFLSVGGELTTYSQYTSVGRATAVANVLSQITQINAALTTAGTPKQIDGVDLDIEGTGWLSSDILNLSTDFKNAGYIVAVTPQIFYRAGTSNNISSSNPSNMILTSGGGTGNNYNLAVASNTVDYILAQTYNSSGFTIDGFNEASPNFTAAAANALNSARASVCSDPANPPFCILQGIKLVLLQVANAGAGGYTIFNSSGSSSPIPPYDQTAILSLYKDQLVSALDNTPAFKGFGAWSMNNDWAPLLYNSSDSAINGAYTTQVLDIDL